MSQHPLLWIEDGNIVIRAEFNVNSESKAVLFKIHRLSLEKHSEVFKNLFALPEPSGAAGEKYLGISMIRLEDTAEDLESLLMLFYHYDYLLGVPESDIPVKLAGAITLAKKYMMDSVLHTLLDKIAAPWPRTFEDFDLREAQAAVLRRKFQSHSGPGFSVHGWPETFLPEPIQTLVFAEEHHLDHILPALYYDLARCSVTSHWDTQMTADGDLFTANCLANGKAARWNLFPFENAMKLYRTRVVLEDITQSILQHFKSNFPSYDCHCSDEALHERPLKILESASKHHIADPLSCIRELSEELYKDEWGREWCFMCKQGFEGKLNEAKDTVWEKVKEQVFM